MVVDWCVICSKNGESVDHLLLDCELTCAICNVFFNWFGLSWVMPTWVVDVFACWWMPATHGVLLCGR
jgi:hypothetical protein